MTVTIILDRLEAVRHTGTGRWIARCPGHDDAHASLSVSEKPDGTILIRSFAGCDNLAVLSSIGLDLHDLLPQEYAHDHGAGARRSRRKRHRQNPYDALSCIANEAMTVAVVAESVAETGSASDRDRSRLWNPATLINQAVGMRRHD